MKSATSQTASKPSVPAAGHLLAGVIEAVSAPVDAALVRAVDQVLTWHQRVRDRRALGQLDAHMLSDVGLSQADVDHEVSKPFWRA